MTVNSTRDFIPPEPFEGQNYKPRYARNQKFPTFYKDIISHWQEKNNAVPDTKKDVLDQIVSNNRFVKINKASI